MQWLEDQRRLLEREVDIMTRAAATGSLDTVQSTVRRPAEVVLPRERRAAAAPPDASLPKYELNAHVAALFSDATGASAPGPSSSAAPARPLPPPTLSEPKPELMASGAQSAQGKGRLDGHSAGFWGLDGPGDGPGGERPPDARTAAAVRALLGEGDSILAGTATLSDSDSDSDRGRSHRDGRRGHDPILASVRHRGADEAAAPRGAAAAPVLPTPSKQRGGRPPSVDQAPVGMMSPFDGLAAGADGGGGGIASPAARAVRAASDGFRAIAQSWPFGTPGAAPPPPTTPPSRDRAAPPDDYATVDAASLLSPAERARMQVLRRTTGTRALLAYDRHKSSAGAAAMLLFSGWAYYKMRWEMGDGL